MSLKYRAIWADERPDLLQAGRTIFSNWLRSKGVDAPLFDNGRFEGADGVELIVAEVSDDKVEAMRVRLNEERPITSGNERWSTTAH